MLRREKILVVKKSKKCHEKFLLNCLVHTFKMSLWVRKTLSYLIKKAERV